MQLYHEKSSPYANCVGMVITEVGIKEQINVIEIYPFDDQEDFIKANPLAKVPCLVVDGETIVDSEVICDYLDANYNGGALFNTIYGDWRLKTFYSICSGLMDVCVGRRVEQTREQEGTKSDYWWQRYNNVIMRTLNDIETRLAILPEEFTVLHINLFSCLSYLDFRHFDIDWRKDFKALADFHNNFSSRQCFVDNQFTDV